MTPEGLCTACSATQLCAEHAPPESAQGDQPHCGGTGMIAIPPSSPGPPEGEMCRGCPDCELTPAVQRRIRGLEAELLRVTTALEAMTQERDEAMRVLAPSMPESGLVDACKQVKQVAISEADNSEKSWTKLEAAERDLAALRDTADSLRAQAQGQAQEARTANATIAEIYQACSGATGEPGNWHGAQPVIHTLAALREERDDWRAAFEGANHAIGLMDASHAQALRDAFEAGARYGIGVRSTDTILEEAFAAFLASKK